MSKTATLTIRGLDERIKEELQARAKAQGRSMEAEVRRILSEHVVGRSESLNSVLNDSVAVPKNFITISNIPPEVLHNLSDQAELSGTTLEEEALAILTRGTERLDVLQIMRDSAKEVGFMDDLEIPARTGESRAAELT